MTMLINPYRYATGGGGGGGGSNYPTEVLADSPVAYWRLGESSGTTATDERGNSDGTYYNSPTLGATGLVDDADTAVSFDPSTTNYMGVPYVAAHNYGTTGEITVECLFKMDVLQNFNSLVQIGTSNQAQPVDMYVDANGQLTAILQGKSITAIGLKAAATYHVAFTYDGTTMKLWVNGTLMSQSNVVVTMSTGNELRVGRRADGGVKMDGVIDEVALYDTALTETQIKSHYEASGAMVPATDLTTISGLKLWCETRFFAEGYADTDLRSIAPNYANTANHLLRTNANAPIHRTAQVNSEPAWEFNGSQVFDIANAIFSGQTAGEVFLVIKSDNDGGTSSGGHWSLGGTSGSLYPDAAGDVYDSFASSTTKATGNPSTALNAWHLYNVSADGSSWTSRHDGTQHYTVASNTVTWPGGIAYLGLNGGTWYLGFIAAIVMFDNVLSSTDRDTVESYLASVYGLTVA